MIYDDELERLRLEAEFLAVVAKIEPRVCQDLGGEPFTLYKEIAPLAPVTWDQLQGFAHAPQVKALRDSLQMWADTWHLTAEWCKDAACSTLDSWKASGRPGAAFWHSATMKMIPHYPAPEGLPDYRYESFASYAEQIEDEAREAMRDHELLKFATVQHREIFIKSLVSSITAKANIKKYCADVETELRPFTPKERRRLTLHLTWAARVHVRRRKGDKQADIAKKARVTPPTVSLAVKTILKDLKLRS